MKFAFLFLVIAISGVAAYFTVTQTKKFQDLQDLRISTNVTIVRVSASNDKRLEEIKVEEGNREVAKTERSNAQSSVAVLKDDNGSLERQVAGLDTKIAAQEVQLGELRQVVTGVKEEFAKVNIDVTLGSLNDDFKGLTTSIETKQGTDKGLDEAIAKDEKKLADKRAEIDRYNGRIQARDLRIAQNEIEARVTAVNHDWGFIVIGAGSNSGFMPDSILLIKRDGRRIGTVKPTAIELTQTIADIDFNSLSPGVRFQPGDEVILAKPASN
ncbi:MAG: hypothetical protein V4727_06465 [Verrucomicrobiota bacterium]